MVTPHKQGGHKNLENLETWKNLEKGTFCQKRLENLENGTFYSEKNDKNLENLENQYFFLTYKFLKCWG